MAIINCPECNGKISSTLSECIHCGAPISVCPECGAVFAEALDACSQCGFVFKKEEKETAPSNTETTTTVSQAVSKWAEESRVFPLFLKFKNEINIVLQIASLALMAFILISFTSWSSGVTKIDDIESLKLLDYSSVLSSMKTMGIIAIVINALSYFFKPRSHALPFISGFVFLDFARCHRYDVKGLIRESLTPGKYSIGKKEKLYINMAISSQATYENSSYKIKAFIGIACCLLGNIILGVALYNFFIPLLERTMERFVEIAILGSFDTNIGAYLFEGADFKSLIAPLIIAVVLATLEYFLFPASSTHSLWVKENLPECEEFYEKNAKLTN